MARYEFTEHIPSAVYEDFYKYKEVFINIRFFLQVGDEFKWEYYTGNSGRAMVIEIVNEGRHGKRYKVIRRS
jgi:hypothetical protein